MDAFTYSVSSNFIAQGSAKAITDTPIGRILLNGINFNITSGLVGLNGLTTYPKIINSVDVTDRAPDAVELTVDLTAINPSNLNLSMRDATFNIINEVPLGNATLPGLILVTDRNDIAFTALFDPNRSPCGLETLDLFLFWTPLSMFLVSMDRVKWNLWLQHWPIFESIQLYPVSSCQSYHIDYNWYR